MRHQRLGDLVADAQVGARFGLRLAWVTLFTVAGIMCFSEMAGRVAIKTRRPALALARSRLGPRYGLFGLVGSLLVTGLLVMLQRHVVRRTGSIAIRSDQAHYATDFLVNISVIAALVLSTQLGWWWIDPAIGLCIALAFAAITKSRLLRSQLGERVSGWRWDLAWATAAGVAVGALIRLILPQTWQLVIGVPAILLAFGTVLWTKGFGPEDRELFRMRKSEVRELRAAEDAALARDQIADDII